jgi:hypothetical protein
MCAYIHIKAQIGELEGAVEKVCIYAHAWCFFMQTYIKYTYIQTYTYIHTYIQACLMKIRAAEQRFNIHTYITYTYIHAGTAKINASNRTAIQHTYITYTYIHTYRHS